VFKLGIQVFFFFFWTKFATVAINALLASNNWAMMGSIDGAGGLATARVSWLILGLVVLIHLWRWLQVPAGRSQLVGTALP
jgi:hypothetical protein